ncbi:MAG: hypothetical protein K2J31_01795 [Alistipes sp.]|nr:hypothetical protein [Alistipes sp.]
MYRLRFNMLGALLVKHYTENARKYAAMYGVSIAVPILFGVLTRQSEVAHAMILTMLIIDIFIVMHISMNELRDRRSAVISNTLPVSITERYVFIFINTTVVFMACFVVSALLSKAVIDAMYPPYVDFIMQRYLTDDHLLSSLCSTHAAAMIINAFARRRLIMTYIAAFLISIVCQYAIVRLGGDHMADINDLKMYANMVMAPLFWIGSFVLLRRKQINW